MSELSRRECAPCKGKVPPLKGNAIGALLEELGGSWRVVDEHHLENEFRFRNFKEAMAFANRVGDLAERVNHHPGLHVAMGRVKVTIYTHKIDGLTESDFVFAAKTDELSLSR
jgi:4a-hydroxytetrahydrobiopterin dehydratase